MNAIHSPGIGSTLDSELPTLGARIIVAGSCMGELVGFCVACVGVVGRCHPVFLVCVEVLGLMLPGLFLVCVVSLCLFAVVGSGVGGKTPPRLARIFKSVVL